MVRTYGNSVQNILGEQDALELNDEEIDELFNIVESSLEGFLWDGVVSARAEIAGKTLREDELPCKLRGSSDTEYNVEGFHGPAKDGEIAAGEDEEDGRGKGDGGSARMFPL